MEPLLGQTARSLDRRMRGWVARRSQNFWPSLAIGLLAAFLAMPFFTDPWLSNVGGFIFVTVVVAGFVRGAIALGQAFLQGWREPRRPTSR